ncbi:MAG: AAA family ATPase, partial [Firmicutes bacterium]|nr:AAA family ATPase [Bacillota bacterium]
MLKSLHIKNVAIISSLTIDFCAGLNVLSGETGAGKSIILDALTFVIGGKADKSLIRFGTSEMVVEAIFDISGNIDAHSTLKEIDIDAEDEIIIYRSLNLQGGGKTLINGQNVVASMLKTVSSCLIDICGQSEHISLLKASNNLKFLDGFCAAEILPARQKIEKNYHTYKEIVKEILSYGGNEAERQKNTDLYDYQIKEIENANLKEGEEEDLSAKRAQLLNIGKIADSLNSAAGLLSGG